MLCAGCQVSLAASRLYFLKFSSIDCKINIRKFGGKPYKHALGGGGGGGGRGRTGKRIAESVVMSVSFKYWGRGEDI